IRLYFKDNKNQFDSKNMRTFFYQNIASLNYYSKVFRESHTEQFKQIDSDLNDEKVLQALEQEYQILKNTSAEWKRTNVPKPKKKYVKKKKEDVQYSPPIVIE